MLTSDEVRQIRATQKQSIVEETSFKPKRSGLHPKKCVVQHVRKHVTLSIITNQQKVVPSTYHVASLPDVKPLLLKPKIIIYRGKNAYPRNYV